MLSQYSSFFFCYVGLYDLLLKTLSGTFIGAHMCGLPSFSLKWKPLDVYHLMRVIYFLSSCWFVLPIGLSLWTITWSKCNLDHHCRAWLFESIYQFEHPVITSKYSASSIGFFSIVMLFWCLKMNFLWDGINWCFTI